MPACQYRPLTVQKAPTPGLQKVIYHGSASTNNKRKLWETMTQDIKKGGKWEERKKGKRRKEKGRGVKGKVERR